MIYNTENPLAQPQYLMYIWTPASIYLLWQGNMPNLRFPVHTGLEHLRRRSFTLRNECENHAESEVRQESEAKKRDTDR